MEVLQRTVVRPDSAKFNALCPVCLSESVFLTPNEVIAGWVLSARDLFRLIESGEIHFLETPTGQLFVCPNSLEGFEKR
ncbi:MAG: hypothetical protein R2747_08080 [Pyrinomonadaceae bacterium]